MGSVGFFSVVLLLVALQSSDAQLVYDKEKGIIHSSEVENKDPSKRKTHRSAADKTPKPSPKPSGGLIRGTPETIHAGREKDGPELYHQSGLEYFEKDDLSNALKNFKQAYRLSPKAEYLLWIGKSHRRLGRVNDFLSAMTTIMEKYPDSEVADDALFELAYHRQEQNDYARSSRLYARLAEQYPFGVSISNGIEYLETTRERRRTMRAEMITALRYLGYDGSNYEELLRTFQSGNGFEVTGKADSATVSRIKEQYARKMRNAGENARMKQRFEQTLRWGVPLGILIFLNLGIVVTTRLKIGRKMKMAAELTEVLTDLDTKTYDPSRNS